jgi:hypothetical protein
VRTLWRNNGLSIVVAGFFLLFLGGQAISGWKHENEERVDHHQPSQTLGEYLNSSAFLEATAENWESEFLQMAAYVWLTSFLYQKGSSESKDPDKTDEPVDRTPDPTRPGAPAPVRRGGLALKLYENSLALTLLGLFLFSFVMHAVGGRGEYAESQRDHGQPGDITVLGYMATSQFWFESFQNWQSEFLAVLSIVVLSIFLRQRGSPESKPVDAPHSETGE